MATLSRAFARLFLAGACAFPAAAQVDEARADESPLSPVVVLGQAPGADVPLSTQSIDAEQIAHQINALTVEDVLRYQPAIFARRRHIGDTQAPITTRTSGVGASARSLVYADGVLLSALIGNNNSTASPRWGMVAPSEIDHVEVRYGPFSAAYPGNSIGAVVEIATRTPESFEATAQANAQAQEFSQYATKETFASYLGQAALGDRTGAFSWRLSLSHLDTEGQPLSFVTALRPAKPGGAGQPVSGAFADVNRTGAPIAVLGAGGIERQLVDNAKLKLSYEPSRAFAVSYLAGYFSNRDDASVQSYLRDATGAAVYAGAINIAGFAYTVPASAFSNNLYRLDERHWMQALTLAGAPSDNLRWQVIGTLYDYATSQQRNPTGALPSGYAGGAGSLLDMGGTGWRTLDGRLSWGGLSAGYHYDEYRLGSDRYATADWRSGPKGPLSAVSRGKTETQALFIEDALKLGPDLRLTLGLRGEHWRAFDGFNFMTAPALAAHQPERSASRTSPKAVLAWTPDGAWALTASAGLAYRFPTVSELYQAATLGTQAFSPNPNLKPEEAFSTELSVQRSFARGLIRASLFTEDVDDALISQTAATPFGSTSFVQNVGHVRSRGAELQGQVRDVLPKLDLEASMTFVDSEITSDDAFPAAVGKRTPQVPRLRWTALATWRATGRLTLTAGARYSDRVFGTIDNSDVVGHTYQGFEGYFLVDARAVWTIDRQWSAALGVENATNDRYFLFHPFPQRSALAELKYAF